MKELNLVRICKVTNGFVIDAEYYDPITGESESIEYVANKLSSYSYEPQCVVNILERLFTPEEKKEDKPIPVFDELPCKQRKA